MAALYSGKKDITLESSSVDKHSSLQTYTQTDEAVALKKRITELENVIKKQKDS